MPEKTRLDMAREFLEEVHGIAEEVGRWFCLFSLPEAKVQWFQSPDEAAECAIAWADAGSNVHTGVGEVSDVPKGGRGKLEDITALVGFVADIDVAGATHADSKKRYAPDTETAHRIIREVGPEPTIIVETGSGGLHAWWLFHEPWEFETAEERAKAVALSRRFSDTVQAAAKKLGYEVDAVSDITRVLRVPGTVNQKNEGAVKLHSGTDCRYEPADLGEYLVEPKLSTAKNVKLGAVPTTASVPLCVLDAISKDARLRKTWERERKDLADQSASAYDLALANAGVRLAWDDDTIAQAIYAWRCKHGEEPEKAQRADYLERTIAKARAQHHREEVVSKLAETAQEMSGPPSEANRAKALDMLSSLFERSIRRWAKVASDPVRFMLELAGPDAAVTIGRGKDVLQFNTFRSLCYEQRFLVPLEAKKEWESILQLLRVAEEVIPDEENSLDGQVMTWLERYLTKHVPYEGEQQAEGLLRKAPLLDAECLWVSLPHLHNHVKVHQHGTVNTQGLAHMLRLAGFKDRTIERDGHRIHCLHTTISLAGGSLSVKAQYTHEVRLAHRDSTTTRLMRCTI